MLAAEVSTFTEKVGVPLVVAVIGLVGGLGAAAVTFAFTRLGEAAARRREGYAEATRELLAWAEYPYRIRRRTSDSAEELTRLANLGHDLQEKLRYRQTWITAENAWLGQVFAEARTDLKVVLGPACVDAWNTPPITAAASMNLASWGPSTTEPHLRRFETALRSRFGWRRLAGALHWHPGAAPRPTLNQIALVRSDRTATASSPHLEGGDSGSDDGDRGASYGGEAVIVDPNRNRANNDDQDC